MREEKDKRIKKKIIRTLIECIVVTGCFLLSFFICRYKCLTRGSALIIFTIIYVFGGATMASIDYLYFKDF